MTLSVIVFTTISNAWTSVVLGNVNLIREYSSKHVVHNCFCRGVAINSKYDTILNNCYVIIIIRLYGRLPAGWLYSLLCYFDLICFYNDWFMDIIRWRSSFIQRSNESSQSNTFNTRIEQCFDKMYYCKNKIICIFPFLRKSLEYESLLKVCID